MLKLAAEDSETPRKEDLPGSRLEIGGGAFPSPCAEAEGGSNSLRVGCGTGLCVCLSVIPSNSFNC